MMYFNFNKNCCYKCEEREPNCHSVCEKYAEYQKKLEKIKKKKMKENVGYNFVPYTRVSEVERIKKKNEQ